MPVGDVPDLGGEAAQDGAEAGGQEAGPGEDGDISTVQRYLGTGITEYSKRTGDRLWRGWGYQYSPAVSRYRQY